MPTSTTRPRGRTMASAWVSDSDVPDAVEDHVGTVGEAAGQHQRAGLAPDGPGQLVGGHHGVGAERLGHAPLVGVLGPDHHRAVGGRAGPGGARAATTARPRVPAPMTATVSPVGDRRRTARRARRRRSAPPSRRPRPRTSRGRRGAGRRGRPGPACDQPPPVSAQNPVWRPGSMSPKATLPHSPVWPAAQLGAQRADVAGGAAQHRLDDRPGPGGQRRAGVVDHRRRRARPPPRGRGRRGS